MCGPFVELPGGLYHWSQVSEEGGCITYRALYVRVRTWNFILSEKKPLAVLS